jgi:membrane protease YdiL (CAAX protease family)
VAQPDQIVTDPAAVELVLGSLSLFVFSGLTEELVFRGLIQRSLEVTLRPLAGLLLANGLFAASYLGTQSASYVLLIAGVGLAFGLCMWRTGSIAGIGIAHGLLSVGAVLVWPYLLG